MNDLIIRRKRVVRTDPFTRSCRFVGRYAVAAVMIPFSVMLGIGGLLQYWSRRLRRRRP